MTRYRFLRTITAVILSAIFVVMGSMAPADGPVPRSRKKPRPERLTYRIETTQHTFRIGDPIPVTATLTNKSTKTLAVHQRAMFRYINYERAPSADRDFGVGGQVIGDGPVGGNSEPAVSILAPGASFAKTLDLSTVLHGALVQPGRYRISIDYCYFGPKRIDGASAPVGCTTSNEVVFELTGG